MATSRAPSALYPDNVKIMPHDLADVKIMRQAPSMEGRPPRKSAYHHGDLRAALIRSAAALVNDRGLAGVTLREVARRAGVSHAAPYHHFSSKASLLAALAAEGFANLDAALARAEARVGADPRARLEAIGVAYVRFALAKPEMFRAMLRASAKDVGSGGPFGRLLRGVRDCLAASPSPARDPLPVALFGWSTVHGLAALWLDGPIQGGGRSRRNVEALAAYASRVFAAWVASGAPAGAPPTPSGTGSRS
jgi:AcrR family transcriptional regulator